jgi:hypothetical protein
MAFCLLANASLAQQPADDRITLADLRTPVQTLTRDELQQLLAGKEFVRTGQNGAPQRWTNQADGTVVAASFTRQGRPLSEFGEWRVNDAGQYCMSMAWLVGPHEAWCRHLVRNRDGLWIADGLALTDTVQRCEVRAPR